MGSLMSFDLRAALISSLLLVGCCPAPSVVYKSVQLDLPLRPAIPAIAGRELQSVSEETYLKLLDREDILWGYTATLESIIRSTHEEKSK